MRSRRFANLSVLLIALLSVSAISVDRLQMTVEWLADPVRDGRLSQSPGAIESADYLLDRFEELGLDAQMQDIGPGRRNVVARSGSALEHVIIAAHYDGQGMGRPSASDNAAGVAVLLELARELKEANTSRSFVFIAFDDEERGLNGSRHYAREPVYPPRECDGSRGPGYVGSQFWGPGGMDPCRFRDGVFAGTPIGHPGADRRRRCFC